MWLHLPQREGQKHMGNHSPTAGMPAASTLSEPTPKALVWGQENRRGSSSTKLLSSLTHPDKGPNDGSDQMQCCESGNHINYWNEQQSKTQSHILHCWKNCLGLILSTLLQKKLLCEQKRKTKTYELWYLLAYILSSHYCCSVIKLFGHISM